MGDDSSTVVPANSAFTQRKVLTLIVVGVVVLFDRDAIRTVTGHLTPSNHGREFESVDAMLGVVAHDAIRHVESTRLIDVVIVGTGVDVACREDTATTIIANFGVSDTGENLAIQVDAAVGVSGYRRVLNRQFGPFRNVEQFPGVPGNSSRETCNEHVTNCRR